MSNLSPGLASSGRMTLKETIVPSEPEKRAVPSGAVTSLFVEESIRGVPADVTIRVLLAESKVSRWIFSS
jgi:hypothetical protein